MMTFSFWAILLINISTVVFNYDSSLSPKQKLAIYTQVRLGSIGLFLWVVPFDAHHQGYGLGTITVAAMIGSLLAYQLFFRN
jgi:hypothetical protein